MGSLLLRVFNPKPSPKVKAQALSKSQATPEGSLACQKAHRREQKQQPPLLWACHRKNNRALRALTPGLLPSKAMLLVAEIGSNY